MLFSQQPRRHYAKSPLHEVICQLRFPAILAINTKEPAEFQDAIRDEFPRFAAQQDAPAPKITGLGGPNPQVEQLPAVQNYNFLSADNRWKINLTRDFIALSTLSYTGWEEFARKLDRPLAEFIRLYHPAFFERVGLRYVNFFSREKLGLEGRSWGELFAPVYAGPLAEADVRPEQCLSCGVDFTLKADSSSLVKIHAGPGQLKVNGGAAPDQEEKFIFDMDLSMSGNLPVMLTAGGMETLHGHATRLFEGALREELRQAMEGKSL